jgi:hypothetical protein
MSESTANPNVKDMDHAPRKQSPQGSPSGGFLNYFQAFSCCVSSRKTAYGSMDERQLGTGARSRPRRKVKQHHPHHLTAGSSSAIVRSSEGIGSGVHSATISRSSSASIKYSPLLENWMGNFVDWKLVDIPAIPGTHHSGVNNPRKRTSQPVWGWAKCQDIGIDEQLHYGVRFLDLRVRVIPTTGEVLISHGLTSDTSLHDALEVVAAYLETHATESVIVYIRADKWHGIDKESSDLLSAVILSSSVKWYSMSDPDGSKWLGTVKVGDVCGKCILVATQEEHLDFQKVPHVIGSTILKYCDIWQSTSIEDAKSKIEQYMQTLPADDIGSDAVFGGVAIDGTFPIRQQSQTSRELNMWFIEQLTNDDIWKKRVESHRFGIVLIDFADFDILNFLMSLNYRLLGIKNST